MTQTHRCALDAAGIYAIVALAHDCPTCAITEDEPPECYPPELKQQGQSVIQAFSKYPNTLAFSAGNEVNHFAPPDRPEWNAPCQKKYIRDMREYVDNCAVTENSRRIPIGLVSADNDREAIASYYNCQSNQKDKYESAEWYGLNSYVNCDSNATKFSEALGFKDLLDSFAAMNYSIPVVLTEFGCLSETFPTINGYEGQRNFQQANWLLTEKSLRDQFSGGFAFEYSLESANAQIPYPFKTFGKQNYGVGYFAPKDCDDIETPCTYRPFPAFDNLKNAYNVSETIIASTQDSFQVPPSRQGRSKCPDEFPPLGSYDWSAVDHTRNLRCPPIKHWRPFSCPAKPSGESMTIQSLQHAFAMIWLTFLSLFLLILAVRQCRRYTTVPKLLTVPQDGDSLSSDESAGLLSMKSYQRGADYQAIDSDSSSI